MNILGTITGYTVYHHITDHLGSVRAITDASTGTVVETSDYLPFGTRWSQTSGSSSATITDATNRWRYSGKEEQKAINSTLPLIDYGARMYDPTIARWMSVDPMAEKYYPMSPYGYCDNNPIIIIDPKGLEWTENNNRITVSVNLTNSAGVSSNQLEEYKSAISSLFNSIISDVSEGVFSGQVLFYENNPDIEQVLDIGVFTDNTFGGNTHKLFSSINVYGKNGEIQSASSFAQSAVHELFHTIRLNHPFESTQTTDTKLIQIGQSSFITTAETDPNIVNNIMNYSYITINGKQGTSLNKLTKGQFEYIRHEIKQQEKGHGLLKGPYLDTYDSYWTDWPGTPVTQ